jgi:hypothetical protein
MWHEKGQQANFENQPIEGLVFLDGDRLAEVYGKDWTKGDKFPQIAFPSGLSFHVWEGRSPSNPTLHLFGEMDLSLKGTRNYHFEYAASIAEQCGYLAAPVGDDQLELISWEDHLMLTFDNEQERIVNVERVRREK